MTILAKYRFSLLRTGAIALYRGTDDVGGTILMAISSSDETSADVDSRLQHEYALRDDLDAQWSVLPIALTYQHGKRALLLNDTGGQLLRGLCGTPMDTGTFLVLAAALTQAVKDAHARGLIHGGISPDNVLVNPASDEVRLTGFCGAVRLDENALEMGVADVMPERFPYMAPEQTGSGKRPVDARSDLYSLGCTFYEMLTGAPPLTATDPMGWVHAHVARLPQPPRERVAEIPDQISAIVMKLLAKAPELRYETAASLLVDVRRCLTMFRSGSQIQRFVLDMLGISGRIRSSEALYGRERELAELLAVFEAVMASGTAKFMFVSGHSGVGKSSLVREFRNRLAGQPHLYSSGKCEPAKDSMPYASFLQALRGLIKPILGLDEADFAGWRARLRAALGANGALLTAMLPELELIVGMQPPIVRLDGYAERTRFLQVAGNLVSAFATRENPLVLFLDDLQWVDSGTLDLLEHLRTLPALQGLLLLGAFRSSEVPASHALQRVVRTQATRPEVMALQPLAEEDVGELLSNALCSSRDHVTPLANLVYERTRGNPFFATQFVIALVDEDLLSFAYERSEWIWDTARIRAKAYTDNVVDLLLQKLRTLSPLALSIVKKLACVGNGATLRKLAVAAGMSEDAVQDAIEETLATGLVYQVGETYSFGHDRVQEAAYAAIPSAERRAMHLDIGRRLAADSAAWGEGDSVFEIASQIDRGASLITMRAERERFAALNLAAGDKAKSSAAYALALGYFAAASELLGPETESDLAHEIELRRAECEFVTGAMAEAETRLSALAARDIDLASRAEVARLRAALYTTLDQLDVAVSVATDFLRRCGIDVPLRPTDAQVERECQRLTKLLEGRAIADLVNGPLLDNPTWRGALDVLGDLVPPALFTDGNLLDLILLKMANLSIEHGHADASCYAYVCLMTIFGPRFGDYQTGLEFGELAMRLVDEKGLTRMKARVHMCFGTLVLPWTRPIATAQAVVKNAFQAALESGDITFAVYSRRNFVSNLLFSGQPLSEVKKFAEESLAFARAAKFGMVVDALLAQLMVVDALHRPAHGHQGANTCEEDLISERHLCDPSARPIAVFSYWAHRLQVSFIVGDLAAAIEAEQYAAPLLWSSRSHIEVAEYHIYGALARAAACRNSAASEFEGHMVALRAHHAKVESWAQACGENFSGRRALISAEMARILGNEIEAERSYDEAIRHARAQGFLQVEALANELAAQFHSDRGLETIAESYLRNARQAYLRWGANVKAEVLHTPGPLVRDSHVPAATGGTLAHQIDIGAVVSAARALSSEIVLERLIEVMLRTVLEYAGAQRCVLALCCRETLHIEAQASVEDATVNVTLGRMLLAQAQVPIQLLQTVLRTRTRIALDDAVQDNTFSRDQYVQETRPRSVLCMPLLKQTKIVGLLYMENNLTTGFFTSERETVTEVLASQAAISIENARLYAQLLEESLQRERAENSLRHMQADLAHVTRLTTMGELVTSIIHEVKQPLAAINASGAAALRWLVRERPEISRAREMLELVVSESTRAGEVIRGIHSLAKKAAPEIATFDINEAIREVLLLTRDRLEDRQIVLSGDALDGRVLVRGDRIQLQQVVLNLVINAVDAMAEITGRERRLLVTVETNTAGWVDVAVEDTGPGLDPAIADRVFESFVTTKPSGMGLGLSICRSIVETHGGTLTASPRIPFGTTFRFKVPAP
ncbi:ATP-binding region ATPase domain protein [Burkholderia sp. H160]|nr:ATP-binding region ATPase domain protein [Burkholderia sp. H160]